MPREDILVEKNRRRAELRDLRAVLAFATPEAKFGVMTSQSVKWDQRSPSRRRFIFYGATSPRSPDRRAGLR